MSTSATAPSGKSNSNADAGSGMVVRAVYRQLLRWCQAVGDDIPLTTYVPPVTLTPPIVDETSLKRLADGLDSDLRALLPKNSQFENDQMTVPLQNAKDIRNFFRAVYRMNRNFPESDIKSQKQRLKLAFETLKSVNELTTALHDVRNQRAKHMSREGVVFSVGQVVQHKTDRWRGIVLGWERKTQVIRPDGQLTSLTTKDYDYSNEEDDGLTPNEGKGTPNAERIRYTMILDSGDAHLLSGRRQVHGDSGYPVAYEQDLEVVKDLSLCRIRSSWTSNYFERFDATSMCFVPNAVQQFEYPLDEAHLATTGKEVTAARERNELGANIVHATQKAAERMGRRILDETSSPESRGLRLVVNFQHRLNRLSSGDVLTDQDRLTNPDITDGQLAIHHLRWFLHVSLEIAELLWQRQVAKEALDRIQYRIGDVVLHKKYNFRGVVVGWDPVPSVDVSKWDGLGDIEHPNSKPFYHVIPDQSDCIRAFGGERSFRYVCEENLTPCPTDLSRIDVDLDLDWDYDSKENRYIPPDDLKFKHGEDIDDENVTDRILTSLNTEIQRLQLAQRGFSLPENDDEMDQLGHALGIDTLLKFLKLANTMDSAVTTEECIKDLWKAHPLPWIRSKLDHGVADLLRGKKEDALVQFKSILEEEPDYAEAWNKASTCYFMLGDMQASMEAAEKALALIPNHFQAMNGLGLIQFETRRYKMAAGTFRQSLSIDPWSPISSRLVSCLDMLHGQDLEEEQGAAEGTAPYE